MPGRYFDRMDLMFDAMGYVMGLSMVWIAKQMIFASYTRWGAKQEPLRIIYPIGYFTYERY